MGWQKCSDIRRSYLELGNFFYVMLILEKHYAGRANEVRIRAHAEGERIDSFITPRLIWNLYRVQFYNDTGEDNE